MSKHDERYWRERRQQLEQLADERFAKIGELRGALRNVCRHQETVAPGAYRLSTTWHIAASALGKANAAGGGDEGA